MRATITAIANQKGGVGKTTTCASLGIGLASEGEEGAARGLRPAGQPDHQPWGRPSRTSCPLRSPSLWAAYLRMRPFIPARASSATPEGVDLLPADITLSGMEVLLVNAMSRETVLGQVLEGLKGRYDHILIDCMPSLGMLTVNALAAADSVLIPVQAHYLPAKGLEQLLRTIGKVRRQINPGLRIDGILLTMVDGRTNFAREISALIRDTYGAKLRVFKTCIPHSIRAAEISAEGRSIYRHDPKGKVAAAYRELTKGVLELEKQRQKHRADIAR